MEERGKLKHGCKESITNLSVQPFELSLVSPES